MHDADILAAIASCYVYLWACFSYAKFELYDMMHVDNFDYGGALQWLDVRENSIEKNIKLVVLVF